MIKMFQWTYIKDKYSENATIISLEACLDIMASPSHHVLKYMANGILKGLTPLMIEADSNFYYVLIVFFDFNKINIRYIFQN